MDETVKIAVNRKVNGKYYKLIFESSKVQRVEPGQFMNVLIQPSLDPFLRRPFSYYRTSGKKVEVLYEILGRGTALLAEKRPGHQLKALGPLGKSFSQRVKGKKQILVAGGVGVPPLVFLAETTRGSGIPPVLLIGCGTKDEVLPQKELSQVKGPVFYATDDGSYGRKGFVTILLHDILKKEDPKSLFVQTCGPRVMMSAVMNLAKEFGVEGEASIDERMACGVGACLGCVVETTEGFKTSCVEGPVFSFCDLV